MPLSFNGTNSRLASNNAFPFSFSNPITLAGWIKTNQLTRVADLLGIAAANNDYECLNIDGATAGDPSRNFVNDHGVMTFNVYGPNVSGTGTWIHLAGVTASSTDRRIYTDGTAGSTNTTSGVINAYNDLYVGSFQDYHDGDIVGAAVWSADLTAAEVASLHKGFPARRIRPQSLRAYYPAIRETHQRMSATIQPTPTSVTYADNPPRLYGM